MNEMLQVIVLIAGVAAFFAAIGYVNRREDRGVPTRPDAKRQVPQKVR